MKISSPSLRTLFTFVLAAFLVAAAPRFVSAQDPSPTPDPVLDPIPEPTPDPLPDPPPPPDGTPIDAQRVWSNTGTDFNTGSNWVGGIAPSTGDVAAFAAAAVTQPNLSTSVSISGLYFTGTGTNGYNLTRTSTQGFTLTGYATAIGAETGDVNAVAIGAENTSGTNTIAVPITLAPAVGSTSTIYQAGGGTLAISGAIIGVGKNLTKTGAGTLTLSGNNTFTGVLTVQDGTLSIATINNSGANGTLGNSANAVVLGGSGTTGTLEFTGITASSTKKFTMATGGTGVFQVDSSGTILTLSGVIDGGGNLTKSGAGTLLLSATETYTGATTINAGMLQIGGNDRLPAGTALTLANTAGVIFDLNNFNQTIGSLSGGGTTGGTVDLGGNKTLTVGNSTSTTFAGVITQTSGSGMLTKVGSGTLTLSNANTYTGSTTVSAGTLLVTNTTGSGTGTGAVTVNGSGTTLGGTGTITGTVTVNSGARVLGGTGSSASGTLTLANNLTLNTGSIIELALGPAGAHSTLNRTGGTWTFAANQAFTFLDFGAQATFYDNIITGLAGAPNTSPSTWTITNAGWTGTFTYDGLGDIDLTLTQVPEPGTWIGGSLALAALAFSQRRRFARGRAK